VSWRFAPSVAPAHRDAVAVGEQRPLPAEFAPVSGAGTGALAAGGSLVLAAVDGALRQVQAHDAVIGVQRLFNQHVEHPGGDPFVASAP
jgi:hypothetical protein